MYSKPLNTAGHIYNWFNGYEWEIALRQWLPHRQLPLNLAKLQPPSQCGRWPHLVGVLGLGHRVRVWISHSRVMVLNQLLGCCVYQRMLSTFVSDGSYSPTAKVSSRCQRVSERCIQTKGVAARINSFRYSRAAGSIRTGVLSTGFFVVFGGNNGYLCFHHQIYDVSWLTR